LTEEARGAELFRDRCSACHAARAASDESASGVPFERWEELIFSANAPLVWARSEYEQTGVLPYLHERGTRVPSLRRLYKKWPYFTNGSAKNLGEVLERARFSGDRFFHDRAPMEGTLHSFSADERAALLAFLRLL
jgi:cytochrome c peroxidase